MSAPLEQDFGRRCAVAGLGTAVFVVILVLAASLIPLHPVEQPLPPSVAIEAGLVGLPAPTAPSPPLPQPQVQPQPAPEPLPAILPKPVKHVPPPRPVTEHKQPRPDAPPVTAPATQAARAEAPAPPSPNASSDDNLSGGTGGARAIFQPTPVIPTDLRRHAMDLVAIVHFTIAPDGTATAELEQATPDPRLNQVLLDTFRRWRFFPGMSHGKPVASVLTLRVPVKVE